MKYIKITTVLMLILLGISCKGNIFTGNLFSALDPYKPPSENELTTTEAIMDEVTDGRFLDYLGQSPELAEKILGILEAEKDDIVDKLNAGETITDDEKQSLLALSQVEFAASEADESLAKTNDLIEDVAQGESVLSSTADLLKKIIVIEDGLTENEKKESVRMQIDAMVNSAEYLRLYQDINTDKDGNYLPPESTDYPESETAFDALYSGVVSYITSNIIVTQEIKDDYPGTTDDDELRKLALTDALVAEVTIPKYEKPAGLGTDPEMKELTEAILEEQGVDKIVDRGLGLDTVLEKLVG